jgi:hypothetical protein
MINRVFPYLVIVVSPPIQTHTATWAFDKQEEEWMTLRKRLPLQALTFLSFNTRLHRFIGAKYPPLLLFPLRFENLTSLRLKLLYPVGMECIQKSWQFPILENFSLIDVADVYRIHLIQEARMTHLLLFTPPCGNLI